MGKFISDPALTYHHAQFILLMVNGGLIALVGPKNFFPTFQPQVRPWVGGYLALALAWAFLNPIFLPYDKHPSLVMGLMTIAMGSFFGLTFYAAKVHRPVTYGVIEIIAGGIGLVIVAFLNQITSVLVVVFGAASSVYIVVRGLSNVNDALAKANAQRDLAEKRSRQRRPTRRRSPDTTRNEPISGGTNGEGI